MYRLAPGLRVVPEIGRRIAARHVQDALFAVERLRSPERAARVFARFRIGAPGIGARLAVLRNNVEFPDLLPVAQFERADPSAAGPFRSGGADVDRVASHERRHADEVARLGIRDLLGPEKFSALGVQRNQIIVSGAADNFSIGEGGAAMGMNGVGVARYPLIGPQNVAVGCVDRDGVMVARRVHDARGNDGRRFGRHFFRKRVRANFGELLHIARRDLSQRAVPRSVEIVIRVGPVPVVRLGRTRGKSHSAKATNGSERDRQRHDEK